MSAIRGTFMDGKIIPDALPSWANGARVVVELDDSLRDDPPVDEDVSPEAIAKRLALMEQVEPWMTPEEDAEWRRQRAEDKKTQLGMWDKWTKDIEKLFK